MTEELQIALDILDEYRSELENTLYSDYSPTTLHEKLEKIAKAKQGVEKALGDRAFV